MRLLNVLHVMLKAIIKLGRVIIGVDFILGWEVRPAQRLSLGKSKISVLGSNSSWASIFTFVKKYP